MVVKVILLLVGVVALVHSKVTIDRIEVVNSEFINTKSEVAQVEGMEVLNMDLTVLKPVEQVMFSFGMFAQKGGEFVPLHVCEPMDPCGPPKPGQVIDPMLNEQMGMLGNMTDLCPLKPGFYAIRNMSFEKKLSNSEMKMPPGTYRIDMSGTTDIGGVRAPFLTQQIYLVNE